MNTHQQYNRQSILQNAAHGGVADGSVAHGGVADGGVADGSAAQQNAAKKNATQLSTDSTTLRGDKASISPQHNTTSNTSILHQYSVVHTKHIDDIAFDKMPNGLIPAIAQDEVSHAVLMIAYCNREALMQTLQTNYAHYFSRSRNQLWKKGEASGNVQLVQQVLVDCDYDAILYIVRQRGNGACHTGRPNCFFNRLSML